MLAQVCSFFLNKQNTASMETTYRFILLFTNMMESIEKFLGHENPRNVRKNFTLPFNLGKTDVVQRLEKARLIGLL